MPTWAALMRVEFRHARVGGRPRHRAHSLMSLPRSLTHPPTHSLVGVRHARLGGQPRHSVLVDWPDQQAPAHAARARPAAWPLAVPHV